MVLKWTAILVFPEEATPFKYKIGDFPTVLVIISLNKDIIIPGRRIWGVLIVLRGIDLEVRGVGKDLLRSC
jgi:hypothetical protein